MIQQTTFDECLARIDTSDDVSAAIEKRALEVAGERGSVCADDLHTVPLNGRDGRIIGAILRKLVKAGKLSSGELITSSRKECHHRPIRRFYAIGKSIQDRSPNFRSETGALFLVRCFVCDLKRGVENYSPDVATGVCAWCGWSENKPSEDKNGLK